MRLVQPPIARFRLTDSDQDLDRWSFYTAADATMRWPVTTLGYGDAGEGFSLANNDLTVTAAGQGLESGDYLVKLEARYPSSGCTSTCGCH